MTTPTTMTASMITTATTMMTDVVVTPSLGGLVVGCVLLLLTGTVVVAVPTILVSWGSEVVPTVWGGEVVPTIEVVSTVWGGEVVPIVQGEVFSSGIDAVEKKHTT